MPSYLLCADVHLGRASVGHGPERTTAAAWVRLCREAARRSVDAIVVAGDLVDEGFAIPRATRALREGFDLLNGIPVYAVRGNHDWNILPELVKLFGDLRPLDCERHGWEESELPGGLKAVGWGFSSPHHDECCFDDIPRLGGRDRLGVLHADVGSRTGRYNGVTPGDLRDSDAAGFWVVGHVHKPRIEANWCYPGSLQPMDIGETGARHAILLEWSPGGGFAARTPIAIADARYEIDRPDLTGAIGDVDVLARLSGRLESLRADGATRVRLRPTGRVDLAPAAWDGVAESLRQEPLLESLDPSDVRPAWRLDEWASGHDAKGLLSRLLLRAERGEYRDDAEVDRLWRRALDEPRTVADPEWPADPAFGDPEGRGRIGESELVRRTAERLLGAIA